MRPTRLFAGFAALVTTALLVAGPASAQAMRTWVSGVGDDANPCSRTAPCQTFAGAVIKTLDGGEINCLDSGAFGPLLITRSLSIICSGVEAGIAGSGPSGIQISASSANFIYLQGLDLEGVGGTSGIEVISAGKVTIVDCVIRGFRLAGVHLEPITPVLTYITNTTFDQNLYGVAVTSVNAGGAQTIATLDNVRILGNGPDNGSFGVAVDGAHASIVMNNSTVIRNQTGLSETNGGLLYSFGNNRVVQNQINGAPNEPNLAPQ
jgi:hypothetical protein